MDSISSVAFQAFTDVAPFRIDTVGHVSIAAVRIYSTLVNIWETKQGTGHAGHGTITSVNKQKHLHHGSPSDCAVTWHLCIWSKWEEKDFVVFLGMKFGGGVLKSKRVNQVLSTEDHKYHLLKKNLFRGNDLIQKKLCIIEP